MTIFMPQIVSAIRIAYTMNVDPSPTMPHKKRTILTILMLVFFPVLNFILRFVYMRYDMKLAQENRKKDKSLIAEKEYFRRIVYAHEKLEMGMESIFQCTGVLILHFLSTTATPVHSGLASVFQKGHKHGSKLKLKYLPIHIHSSLFETESFSYAFVIFTFAWSFKTYIKSNLKALMVGREHFPIQSMLSATAYCIFSFTPRLLSYLMYFAAPLGLFSLLRHLQGEMIPMNAGLVYNFVGTNLSSHIQFGDSQEISWQRLDRWEKNESFLPFDFIDRTYDKLNGYANWNPNYLVAPPDYDIYTGFRLRWYYGLLLIINLVHIALTFVFKWKLSAEFKKLHKIDMLIHCFENIHCPYNVKEWDDGKGNAKAHRERMEANWKESLCGIWLNAFFNIIQLFPLCVLGKFTKLPQILTQQRNNE